MSTRYLGIMTPPGLLYCIEWCPHYTRSHAADGVILRNAYQKST